MVIKEVYKIKNIEKQIFSLSPKDLKKKMEEEIEEIGEEEEKFYQSESEFDLMDEDWDDWDGDNY